MERYARVDAPLATSLARRIWQFLTAGAHHAVEADGRDTWTLGALNSDCMTRLAQRDTFAS
jgi:hypothetical protein